jgi:uncharacterized protein YndB with AHSA1/START domain
VYNEYRFVDRWLVPAPVEEAYDAIGNTLAYPTWWGATFLAVEGDAGPPQPGRHAKILSRGKLPYKLRWEAEIDAADAPHGFSFTMHGDFVGSGAWAFEPAGGGETAATFTFAPRVEKPVVKQLSPLLKPLFAWNHRWAMEHGQRGIRELFAAR